MLSFNRFLISSFVLFSVINGGLFKQLPSYIHVCKRDPDTISDCVIKSIESLRGELKNGIEALGVPSLDPLVIEKIDALTADNAPIRASGHNIKITGASNFAIKSLSVDLDTLQIKARVRMPKLHFEGLFKMDAQLIFPLAGEGTFDADAIKCETQLVIYLQTYIKDGQEYLKFKQIDTDINIKDYRVNLVFKGDNNLGEAANQAINQNRGEIYKSIKPHLEKTVSTHVLNVSNRIVEGLTMDQVLPKP